MCPFTFLLQYLVYFFLLFSEKKFNFKKYLSKAIDSLGTKHGFKSIMHQQEQNLPSLPRKKG